MRRRRFSVGVEYHMAKVRELHGARVDLLARTAVDLGKYMFSDDARAHFRRNGFSAESLADAAAQLKTRLISTDGWARLRELNEELEQMRKETGFTREQIAAENHWPVGFERSIYNVRGICVPQPEHNRIPEAESEKTWRPAVRTLMEERESRAQSQEMAVTR